MTDTMLQEMRQMTNKEADERPERYKALNVREADFLEAAAEAKRLSIKKADFLAVLLRGWNRLSEQQQLECIPNEAREPVGTAPAA